MTRPLVAILCREDSPHAELEAKIETDVISDVADVLTVRLPEKPRPDQVPAEVREALAHIVWHTLPIAGDFMATLKRSRALIRNGVGYDGVDIAAAAALGIPVCNVPDYGTEEVADHAIALALALCRRLFPLDLEAKRLGWMIENKHLFRRFRTQTFGILGLGRIGTAAALRAKALSFRVIFYDPYRTSGTEKALGLERVKTLDELLAASDVLSIHTPLTEETRGMIGEQQLARMKPTAYLVNTARGDIVRKAPLFAALRAGKLGGAGLDVIENEPLRTKEEASTPNLIATCHAAFCSLEGMREMRTTSARIARAAVLGEPVWNRVN